MYDRFMPWDTYNALKKGIYNAYYGHNEAAFRAMRAKVDSAYDYDQLSAYQYDRLCEIMSNLA